MNNSRKDLMGFQPVLTQNIPDASVGHRFFISIAIEQIRVVRVKRVEQKAVLDISSQHLRKFRMNFYLEIRQLDKKLVSLFMQVINPYFSQDLRPYAIDKGKKTH